MEYKICAFIGHNKFTFTPAIKEKITNYLETLITEENYGIFRFGGLGEFDYACWEIVGELKEKYPFIKRKLCLWADKYPWWAKAREYDEIEELPLDFDYWYSRLYYRNTAMIDLSDTTVFFVENKNRSGAYKALQYATAKKKNLINFGFLAE